MAIAEEIQMEKDAAVATKTPVRRGRPRKVVEQPVETGSPAEQVVETVGSEQAPQSGSSNGVDPRDAQSPDGGMSDVASDDRSSPPVSYTHLTLPTIYSV